MKNRIILIVCAAVLVAAFGINAIIVGGAKQAAEKYDTVAALSDSEDKLNVSLSAIYKRAGDIVLSLPHAGMTLTQTAVMKHFAGDSDAILYLNTKAGNQLENAYAAMDALLADFDGVLAAYSVPSGSVYRTKRVELATLFSGLESSNNELIRRTRTFISNSDSGYDSYYTAYCEQLQIVSEKFENAATQIGNEYDALVSDMLGDGFELIS